MLVTIYDLFPLESGGENVPEYDRRSSNGLTFDNRAESGLVGVGKGEIVPFRDVPFRVFCIIVKSDRGKFFVQGYKFRAFLP